MYENISYEDILKRMLDRVPSSIDKREGSIIYDALAPAAVELQNMYIELDVILDETFADTASRERLIKRAGERGIVPEVATYAILRGEFNIDISIGSRFSLDDLNYVAIEKIGTGIYKMRCETLGVVGNQNFGVMIPIDYIEELETAKLTELLIPGEDEEETEHLRGRYFGSLESEAFGGNVTDYKERVNALAGVGGVKVYPVWNGGGTVKLVIVNSVYEKPSVALIDMVQTAIDPVINQGVGVGIAPIGHVVTVVGVENTIVNIASAITYQEGWTWEDVKPYVEKVVDAYFKELATTWAGSDVLIVRISQVEIRLLNVTGIVDIAGTTINGLEQNLALGADNIPVRGSLSG